MDELLADSDYQYDIFLSYRRDFVGDWIHEHFLELFRFHLQGGLGYSPRIFVDTEAISAGDVWPERLKVALARSKCLVAMLSPSYFESEWCMKECHTMLAREKTEGLGVGGNGKSLIIPAIVSDGQFYPEYIKSIQSEDFRDFVVKGAAFTTVPLYIDFQVKIRKWAEQVAFAVNRAPAWNSEWLDDTAIDIPKLTIPRLDTPPYLW